MSPQSKSGKKAMPPGRDQADDEPQQEQLRGYARYRHRMANVRKRRTGYKLFIFLAIVVFLLSLADILLLDSALQYGIYAAYAILFLWGVILLFSRRRPQEDLDEMKRLERMLLQCPDCNNVFQYGEINFENHKRTAFSCPICGVYSTLPDPTSEPVKAVAPEGSLKEFAYVCRNCGEDIRVGTFGDQPMHITRFRACPHCGEKGYIERVPLPPEEFAGDPSAAPA